MKTAWLHHSNQSPLILFFAGWGMDEHPFQIMPTLRSDILMVYDYRSVDPPAPWPPITDYDTVTLVGWSLGVAVATRTCRDLGLTPDRAVAVNGTPFPADDDRGIPPALFDATLANLSDDGLARFFRRMCHSRDVLATFLDHAPQRPLAERRAELAALRRLAPCRHPVFERALISQQDRIVPPLNQQNAWQALGIPTRQRPGAHFPFYTYTYWEELVDDAYAD